MKEIFKALKQFQSECPGIKKDSTNPFFKSKYADLAGIWETIQPILAKCDLVVIQPIRGREIITTLIHSSGETVESNTPIVCKSENNPQDFGSAITYARRYALSSLLGIVTEDDDDGNKANLQKQVTKPASKQLPPLPVQKPVMTEQEAVLKDMYAQLKVVMTGKPGLETAFKAELEELGGKFSKLEIGTAQELFWKYSGGNTGGVNE